MTSPIDVFVQGAREGVYPGGQLAVSRGGVRLAALATGLLEPHGAPTDERVLYDLASLTKPLATALLFGRALEAGLCRQDDPIARARPQVDPALTFAHALEHSTGYPPHLRFDLGLPDGVVPGTFEAYRDIVRRAEATAVERPPGTAAVYSDIGFIVLGAALEALLGAPLSSSFAELGTRLFFRDRRGPAPPPGYPAEVNSADPSPCRSATLRAPLAPGYPAEVNSADPSPCRSATLRAPLAPGYPAEVNSADPSPCRSATLRAPLAPGPALAPFAPTEHGLAGDVHDENARAMGGAAGHAGLFGTADAVLELAEDLVRGYHGQRGGLLEPETVRRLWAPSLVPGSTRTLGWDRPAAVGASTGGRWPRGSVGHLGFTGTSVWIEPERALIAVLVTNRVCPTRQNEAIRTFRPRLHDAIWASWS